MLSKKGAMNNNKTVYGQIKLVILCVDNFSHLYHFTTVYDGTEQYITPVTLICCEDYDKNDSF